MQEALQHDFHTRDDWVDRQAELGHVGTDISQRRALSDAGSHAQSECSAITKGPMARIYKPAPSVMQSGRANTRRWVMEFEPQAPLFIEPLMGWTGSTDPLRQVRLTFPDKESAVRFAEREGYAFTVIEPRERRVRRKSYAENFRYRPSTHRR
jgi:hypothetical protein